ncbi:homoserine kinase [Pacificoceanicola onchidii]|uniref:homoserine kinase n=1 Tax=Pacificoceanicola onchidii TaxID=2562685 RepID=UPI001F113354|nr:homoserine kinase [Pacificoceanicola onchidii]
MTDLASAALTLWGMQGAPCSFVAGRENRVYRVQSDRGDFALRLRRPGLRSAAELRSELDWMAAMGAAGLSVPRPEPSRSGQLLEEVDGHRVDMVSWLDGTPLGKSREALTLPDPEGAYLRLGQEMARLHDACDSFTPPQGFHRIAWDREGLLGEAPLWGRFWENPTLDAETRALLEAFRARAARDLEALQDSLDYGLIHADLVRENVLLDGGTLSLIDFDDGGYGFRLFDVATALLKNRNEPLYEPLTAALLAGYRSQRPLESAQLGLFMALRAATYVGWIVPRMGEDGAAARNARFTEDARALCADYLRHPALS